MEVTDGHKSWNNRLWDKKLDPVQDDGFTQDMEQQLGHQMLESQQVDETLVTAVSHSAKLRESD